MASSEAKAGWARVSLIAVAMLAAGALTGCLSTSVERSPGADGPREASPAAARAEIARICLQRPEKYFGIGKRTTRSHCDCYGSGVVKMLNKEELRYVVTYHEVPSLSSDQYDQVLARCLDSGPAAPDKADPKKKKP